MKDSATIPKIENANYTNLIFVGSDGTKFTGNVYLVCNGYSGGGFANHKGAATFEKFTFDGANSILTIN